jgi:ABC-type Fe3+/spermidine/putrescine transport system ATPase subunit
MVITVEHLRKAFMKGQPVVDDISFAIQPGEMFFLLGPSGCGKTTVLRMLAGFVTPDSGRILFDGREMNQVPPQHRNTAMVFQNYAIWPHLTVYENVAYGPRARKLDTPAIAKRVTEALRVVRLEDLANRRPAQLSGGQQQRVALARALAVEPGLILFDEPLSNLDTRLRLELRTELQRIHQETRTTCLYVTHDQSEALSLADRIGVMKAGRIEQIGTPREVYEHPANEFTARFMGEMNILSANSPLAAALQAAPGRRFGFRPEAAMLGQEGIPGKVILATYLGDRTELRIEAGGESVILWSRDRMTVNDEVRFIVPPEKLIAL